MSECAIKVWDLDRRAIKMTLSSHWREISSLAFSSDGDYLVSGAFDKTINIWDTATGKLITTLIGHKNPVIGVGITNDNKKIISISQRNIIKIWDIATETEIKEINLKEDRDGKKGFDLVSFTLSPDTDYIIGGLQGDEQEGGLLKIWKVSDGSLIQTLPIKQNFRGYCEELNEVAISRDGDFIIAASRDRMVKVWVDFLRVLGRVDLYQEFSELL